MSQHAIVDNSCVLDVASSRRMPMSELVPFTPGHNPCDGRALMRWTARSATASQSRATRGRTTQASAHRSLERLATHRPIVNRPATSDMSPSRPQSPGAQACQQPGIDVRVHDLCEKLIKHMRAEEQHKVRQTARSRTS